MKKMHKCPKCNKEYELTNKWKDICPYCGYNVTKNAIIFLISLFIVIACIISNTIKKNSYGRPEEYEQSINNLIKISNVPENIFSNIKVDITNNMISAIVETNKDLSSFEMKSAATGMVKFMLITLREKKINPVKDNVLIIVDIKCPRYSVGLGRKELDFCSKATYDPLKDIIY